MGVECTPWCWFNVAVNYKDRPDELAAMQQRSLVFLHMCVSSFRQQLEHGDEAFLENPDHSSLFKHRLAKKILNLRVRYRGRTRTVHYRTACMCRFGKVNSQGQRVKKRLVFLITDGLLPAFSEDLCGCTCKPDPSLDGKLHVQVKGAETRMSMAYPDGFVDHVLGRVLSLKAACEPLMMTTDSDHGVCENFVFAVGFADVNREEAEWHPVFEAVAARFEAAGTLQAFFVYQHDQLFSWIERLVPWTTVSIQCARTPKANRWQAGQKGTHRCTALKFADGTITIEAVRMSETPGSRNRFKKAAAFGVFIMGDAPDDASAEPAEPSVDAKSKVSAEVWFENLDSRIPDSMRRSIARLHCNLGHPVEEELLRNLSFAGASKDALLCVKSLRCAVCLRHRAKRSTLRPAKHVVMRVFNDLVWLDIFYAEDSTMTLWPMMGILDDATFYHVVIRIEELTAAHCWRIFSLCWASWAGPPRKLLLDQQRGYLGEFRQQLETAGTELEFVPRNAHHKLGRAERHNAAWRGKWKKVIDQTGAAGSVEVDIAATSVSFAKNTCVRRSGASPQQALFCNELTLPDSLLAGGSDEQLAQRRMTIRAAALSAFFQYDVEQSIARGLNAQSRPYRGDCAPGEKVAVFWKI